MSLPTILFLIFLIMRLTDTIDWPWYVVASPILIAWGLGGLIVLALILSAVVFGNR